MMVVYLPISVLKDWICSLLKNLYRNLHGNYTSVSISNGLSVPFRIDDIHQHPEETDIKSSLITAKELKESEEGMLLVKKEEHEPQLVAQGYEHSSWEIAKSGLYLTPIWFASEVTGIHLSLVL